MENDYLECEKKSAFYILMYVGGFFGAFILESVPNYIKWHLHICWEMLFPLLEMGGDHLYWSCCRRGIEPVTAAISATLSAAHP